jgi:hypothetical protein
MMASENDYSYTDLYAVIEKRVAPYSSKVSSEDEKSALTFKRVHQQRYHDEGRINNRVKQSRDCRKKSQELLSNDKTEILASSKIVNCKKSLSVDANEREICAANSDRKKIAPSNDIRTNAKSMKRICSTSIEKNQDMSNQAFMEGRQNSTSERNQEILDSNPGRQKSLGIPRNLSLDKTDMNKAKMKIRMHPKSQNSNDKSSSSQPSHFSTNKTRQRTQAVDQEAYREDDINHKQNGLSRPHHQNPSPSNISPSLQSKKSDHSETYSIDDHLNTENANEKRMRIAKSCNPSKDKIYTRNIGIINDIRKKTIKKAERSLPTSSTKCNSQSLDERQVTKSLISKEKRTLTQTNPIVLGSTASEHHHRNVSQLLANSIHQCSIEPRKSRSLSPIPLVATPSIRRPDSKNSICIIK